MWVPVLSLIFGFILLVWSADRFLTGAAATASNLGVSKMLIGLTVVSVGTSAPEILVALAASIEGNPMLAVGNAIGSNIANIGLVLGITAVIAPLPFSPSVLKSELPWLLAATVLAIVLLFDLYLSPLDGIILLSSLALILYRLTTNQKRHPDVIVESIQDELDELPSMNNKQAIIWLVIGLVILLLSAELLVWAATKIAVGLGVSDLIIGLTVVAVGTSLPELAATLGAAVKGHSDIAIGNIVGSNMLNILAVLAVPALVHPTALDTALVWRDSGMMLALTLLLILFAFGLHSRPVITRFEGIVMVLAWLGYMTMLAMGG